MAATKSSSTSAKKPPTKSEILNQIAADTKLTRKDVSAVLGSLEGLIAKELKPRGAGYFNLPGLLKIKVVKKPARKARKGVNPFTGEDEFSLADAAVQRANSYENGELRTVPVTSRKSSSDIDPNDPSTWGKVSRNKPCPCGSGKKYKHCHGAHA